jgi:universal stress protein A
MAAYLHIVVATDLSPISRLVVMKAQSFAQQMGGQLQLLHVVEPSPLSYGGEFSLPVDPELADNLHHQAELLLKKQGILVGVAEEHQIMCAGSIKVEVAKFVEAHQVDLVILGRHGHHGFSHLLGSTAQAITHVVPCDVLMVSVHEEV